MRSISVLTHPGKQSWKTIGKLDQKVKRSHKSLHCVGKLFYHCLLFAGHRHVMTTVGLFFFLLREAGS